MKKQRYNRKASSVGKRLQSGGHRKENSTIKPVKQPKHPQG